MSRLPALLVLLGSLLMGVLLCWPAPLHPASWLPVTAFTEGHIVAIGLGSQQFPWVLGTDRLGWPDPVNFRPLLWPALPLALLTGPILALNILFWTVPFFNAAGGLLLGRSLRLEPWAAASLAALLAWNTWVYNTVVNGQLEQAYTGGVAMLWAAALEAGRRGGAWILGPGLCALGVGLAAPHVALVGMLGLPLLGVWELGEQRGRSLFRWAGSAVVVGVAALWVQRYHAPAAMGAMSVFAPKGQNMGHVDPWQFESASWRDFYGRPILATDGGPSVIHTAALGAVTSGFAALGLRRPGYRLAFLALAGLFVWSSLGLSVGGHLTPLGWLAQRSPELQRSSNPYRMALGAVVALSALASAAVRGPKTGLLVWALAWSETIWLRTRSIPMKVAPFSFEVYDTAVNEGPVLDLPLINHECPTAAFHYAVQAVEHRQSLLHTMRLGPEAYGRSALVLERLGSMWAESDCRDVLPNFLDHLGIRTVVTHEDLRCQLPATAWSCLEGLGTPQVEGAHRIWHRP